MSLIQTPWTSQPQQAVGIDWSNPITLGLISVQDAKSGRDLILGSGSLFNSAAISYVVTGAGVATNYNQNQIDFPAVSAGGSSSNATLLFIGAPTTGTWNVACVNHGFALRRHNTLMSIALNGYVNRFDFSPWTKEQNLVFVVGDVLSTASGWIDGRRLSWSSSTTTTWTSFTTNTLGGSITGDRSSATWWAKPAVLSARWNRALSEQEAKSLSANPWQIFKPLPRRIFVPVSAGGGTTAVTADQNASYTITGSVAADASAAYAIRAAVTADATASYALRTAVAADSAASYALRAAAQADQPAAYAIRAAVASDLASSYAIQTAGTVTTGLDAAYAVRGSVAGDISVGYQIAAAVQAEVAAAYAVRAAVQKDLSAGYAIDAGVSSVTATLSAAYWIDGEAVVLTPDDKFIARGAARNKTVTAAARRYQIATRSS